VSTGTPSRVYLARLAGVLAFDPNGDQVGKIRDVVVTARIAKPPRVVGLVVEVSNKRHIFLPIGRVTSFDVGAIVVTGVVNMRRFQRRQTEHLALAELLDRQVRVAGDDRIPDGESTTVIDLGVTQNRTLDWEIDRVYVRRPGKTLRRRGESYVVRWDQVRGLLETGPDQAADALLASWERLKPADIANALQQLPADRQLQAARALPDERLADVMEELPDEVRVAILGQLEVERAADILEDMQPDDAADLVGDLDAATASHLLERMEPEEAEELRRLMAYAEDTAGGMMTTGPVIVGHDSTVAEALARISNRDLSPPLASQVYVVRPPLETPTGKLLGAAHFQRLLREPPATLVSAVVDTELAPITVETQLAEVARYFATYNLAAAPVVDIGGHLVGAVTVDDVIDHMLPEDWRELVARSAAVRSAGGAR
jgi:flagellar motility protein MotE (MotC chaperone)/sporulation protein YlmC with PRC-barrel domain